MRLLAVAGLVVIAAAARADITQLSQPAINALTPIDSLPSSEQINQVFNTPTEALATLIALANPTSSGDPGVQLRAVRALIHYCASTPCPTNDQAHTTLLAVEGRYADARTGSDVLMLRAAIEALGVLRVPNDMLVLAAQLQHPSRDIRAATARALRDLGNTQAIPLLRARYNDEPDGDKGDQVRSAISDALRVLGQPVQ